MIESVRGATWFDGRWWEVDLPAGWTHMRHRRDLFHGPDGTRLWIVTTRTNPQNPTGAAPRGLPPAEREAYADAASEAATEALPDVRSLAMTNAEVARDAEDELATQEERQAEAGKTLRRHECGLLVGYSFVSESTLEGGWIGWFASDPWLLRVGYRCRKPAGDEAAALSILSSMRFF